MRFLYLRIAMLLKIWYNTLEWRDMLLYKMYIFLKIVSYLKIKTS